jgi:hypothetical protein
MSIPVETALPSVTTSVTQEEKADSIKSDHHSAGKLEKTSSALEDDWEIDPANPRNWSINQKWVATMIVKCHGFISRFALNFFFFFSFIGVALHICFSTGQFNDGTWFTGSCNQVWDNKSYYRWFDFEYIFGFFRHRCPCYIIITFILNPFSSFLTIIAPFLCTSIGNVWSNLGEASSSILKPSFFFTSSFQVLHIGNLALIAFSLGCAFAPTTGVLIGLRFMCMSLDHFQLAFQILKYYLNVGGLAGSTGIGIGAGSISDMFSEHDRAGAMAMYVLGPLFGTYYIIGPLAIFF